jgi:4-hydroxybenzoate polyprenyltransferase
MKTTKAFFKLIRWGNLLFAAITQLLFHFCIVQPAFKAAQVMPNLQGLHFFLLVLSYCCMGAAGYIINDYFDVNIDQVNKPKKVYIGNYISKRTAILWHIVLSSVGVGIGFGIDFFSNSTPIIGISAIAIVLVMFLYSTTFKKKFLIGNIIVAATTAWAMVVLTWAEANHFNILHYQPQTGLNQNRLMKLTILYTAFAFIISLIREVVKDMEDVEGDRKYGCKTMPIVWGMNATKVFVAVWIVVLAALLLVCQLYVIQYGWWLSIFYCIATLIVPLVLLLSKLQKAQTSLHYHQISTSIKKIMLFGILSMLFFWWYTM